jgi:AcrR family transcriptional regulator
MLWPMEQSDKRNPRREELTEQATEYLKANGLASLTYRKLADELGVAPNTLEHHFGSKDKLLEQLLARLANDQRSGLQTRIAANNPTPADFDQYFWAALEDISEPENDGANKLFFELVGASVRDRDLYGEFLSHAMDDWITFIEAALREHFGMSADRSVPVAHAVLAVIRGIMLSRQMVEETDRGFVDEAARLLGPMLKMLVTQEVSGPSSKGTSEP